MDIQQVHVTTFGNQKRLGSKVMLRDIDVFISPNLPAEQVYAMIYAKTQEKSTGAINFYGEELSKKMISVPEKLRASRLNTGERIGVCFWDLPENYMHHRSLMLLEYMLAWHKLFHPLTFIIMDNDFNTIYYRHKNY